jgi:hypothetical protein
MTQQYRICHNCGASLTPDQAYCPRCGAQYIEPIIQQPVVPVPGAMVLRHKKSLPVPEWEPESFDPELMQSTWEAYTKMPSLPLPKASAHLSA